MTGQKSGFTLNTNTDSKIFMGMQDRHWYRQAQREREKKRQTDESRARFSPSLRKSPDLKAGSAWKTGLIPMMIFWFLVMGVLYGLMTHYQKLKQAQVLANGDLVINRSQDGHFYTTGMINGTKVKFMVDTGASLVSVSEKFAQKAFIFGGVPTTFKTANGDQPGHIVDGVVVSVGPVNVTNLKVGVGLRLDNEDDALLGQSFLSKFDISIKNNQMVLRPR